MIKEIKLILLLGAVAACSARQAAGPTDTISLAEGAPQEDIVVDAIDQLNAELALVDQRTAEQRAHAHESEMIMHELKLRGAEVHLTKRGVVVNLPDVLFSFDSADLSADALRAIREIAVVAKNHPKRHLAVEGHTDAIGTVLYNKKLSEKRAHRVAEQLQKEGIPAKRLTVFGFGETKPIASNRTDAGRTRNRRVEVIFEG